MSLMSDSTSITTGENSNSEGNKRKLNKSKEGKRQSMDDKRPQGPKLSRSRTKTKYQDLSTKMSEETDYLDMLISDVDNDDASRSVLHRAKSNVSSRSRSPRRRSSISRDRATRNLMKSKQAEKRPTKPQQIEKLPKPLPNITEVDDRSSKPSAKPTGQLRPHLVSPNSEPHPEQLNEGKDGSPKTKKGMRKKLK